MADYKIVDVTIT